MHVVNTTVFLSEAIKHRYLALCHPEFFNRRTIYDDLTEITASRAS